MGYWFIQHGRAAGQEKLFSSCRFDRLNFVQENHQPVALKQPPPGQHAEKEKPGMEAEKPEVKSGMNEDIFRQESPVDSPLENEDSAEVERTLQRKFKKRSEWN